MQLQREMKEKKDKILKKQTDKQIDKMIDFTEIASQALQKKKDS